MFTTYLSYTLSSIAESILNFNSILTLQNRNNVPLLHWKTHAQTIGKQPEERYLAVFSNDLQIQSILILQQLFILTFIAQFRDTLWLLNAVVKQHKNNTAVLRCMFH